MTNKKELENEQLEKANGGLPYIGTTEPTPSHYYYQVGDVAERGFWIDNGNTYFKTNFRITKLGKKQTYKQEPIMGYSLYYRMEPVDRAYAQYDGWYDLVVNLTGYKETGITRVPDDGIIVVDE